MTTVPGEAGTPRGAKGCQAGPSAQEADSGSAEEGRDGKGVPKGKDAALKAGARAADGPDGRHGGAQRLADPGQ